MSKPKAPEAAPVAFNVDDLTIGEVEAIEEASGKPLSDVFGTPGAIQMRAIAFVVGRRTDPAYTWAAAGDVKVSALGDLVNSEA